MSMGAGPMMYHRPPSSAFPPVRMGGGMGGRMYGGVGGGMGGRMGGRGGRRC